MRVISGLWRVQPRVAIDRQLSVERVNKYEVALSMVTEAYGAMVEAYADLHVKVAEVQVACQAVHAECGEVLYHLDGTATLASKLNTRLIDSIGGQSEHKKGYNCL